MPKYDKLVRDKIPEIIHANGDEAVTHIADDEEYCQRLFAKLREEVEEFIEDPSVEELADVQEVLAALRTHFDFAAENVEHVRVKKKEKRGGFAKRIVLEETN